MNKFIILFLSIVATLLASPTPSGTISIDYASQYVFRGVLLSEEAIQPTVNLQYGPAYLTSWASRPAARGRQASEIDYTIGATAPFGLDGGVTSYTYTDGAKTTWEPYLGFSRDVGDKTKASIYAFRDTVLRITTFEVKASFSLVSIDKIEASVDGVIGVSKGRELPSYSYWSGGTTVKYQFTKGTFVVGTMQYVSSSDIELKRDMVVAKVGLGFSF